MQWPLAWLEALGLLAIVFAAGTGIGFGLSHLSGPRRTRKALPPRRPAATPPPVEPVAVTEAPAIPAPAATAPKPDSVVSAPALPLSQVAFTMKVRYSTSPFGTLSVTRPNPDQPSS